jgi:hypothetical protein
VFNQLQAASQEENAITEVIASTDQCFLQGFSAGQNLSPLCNIFNGTPLANPVSECVEALSTKNFTDRHFLTLAAARNTLQGTLYDLLRQKLNRSPTTTSFDLSHTPHPLLDSTRHWLVELAVGGWMGLERETIVSFTPTLSQIQANGRLVKISSLLTGFIHELLTTLPVRSPDEVPLMRWCDLWSTGMLATFGYKEALTTTPVSGTLYPLGIDLRQHSRMVKVTGYGVLDTGVQTVFTRFNWSSFKVAAVQGDEIWLLFPQMEMWLESLALRESIILKDIPMLPSGDLLWVLDSVQVGEKFNLFEKAHEYCTEGLIVPPIPPLERHPIHIAEPSALRDYRIEGNSLRLNDGTQIRLATTPNALSSEELSGTTHLFGLLRYDQGGWYLQALNAASDIGKRVFVGEAGAELLKKPPKNNTVAILKERASRLLRK